MNLKEALYSDLRLKPLNTPIPGKDDKLVAEALRDLRGKSPAELDQVAANLSNDDRAFLDGFAQHFASWAVRTKDVELVRLGLFALELADRNRRASESESMPLLYDALTRIGLNAKSVFAEWVHDFTGITRERMERVARKGSTPIAQTRFRVSEDDEDFRYVAIM